MLDVIDVLEEIGQDASLRNATPEALEQGLRKYDLDADVAAVLRAGDAGQFQRLLGGDSVVCAILMPDGDHEDDEGNEKETEEDPVDEKGSSA